MRIFLSLRFYNFIKEILRIYMVFFKKVRPWFVYLTNELVQILQFLTELIFLCLKKLMSMEIELSKFFIYTV